MKKLTLILSLLVAMVTTAMAQESITISVDQNLTQQWTSNGKTDGEGTYAPWGTDVIADYPTGITPSSGNEVHMTTTSVTIEELGRLSFTFQWTTGSHRLNILGVDLLNAESEVVASDYHNGQTGGNNVNNTYTFIAAAGTYTVRYFVEHNTNGNDLRLTNGTITGTLTNVDATKAAIQAEFESFANTGMFTADDISQSVTAIQEATATTVDEFKLLETTHFIYFYSTLNDKCFTFNSKGRSTTNGRYLGVSGLNLDGTMNIVATDANELKNIWKLEYVYGGKFFRLKNIAYDVYAKPIASYGTDKTIQTTSSQEDAGQYLIASQGNLIAIGDRADVSEKYFFHEAGSGQNIVRWSATAASQPSLWTAMAVEEPELCSITYNNIYESKNIQTEKLNVVKGAEYTYVNNFSKTGLSLKSATPVPAAEVINENKVITYEYENILPFEPATVTSENRLAQGSKLYKITLRGKSVQLNADGTEFEYNNNAAIENQLFAVAGSVFDDWQMFNYAAGLNKPIWSPDNNNGTKMVPTAGVKDKLEIVLYNDNTGNHWSFKKKGTNYYLHDYGSNFAVWNDGTAYDDAGSYVVFTEATDKEISIATLNLDLNTATPYLSEELLDETIKTNLQNVVNEANTALTDANSTAEKLNEIDSRLYQLAKEAANDMVVTNANGFKNNGVYTFVSKRGWLLYASENPGVVASSKKYQLELSGEKDYCQWAMHKSVNGNYYMYNIGAGKFVGDSNGNIPFVASPTNDIKILAGELSGYPIMIATNTSSIINHFNNTNAPGVANWSGGQTNKTDEGNCHVVTKVGFINDETLASITEMVDVYEAYINKPNLQAKIEELTSFKESSFLTDEEKATIDAAITEAQAVYDNPKYSTVAAEITKLNELKKQVQYIWNTENLSNNVCYIVSTEDRGSWFAEETETDGTRLNSTGKKSTNNENDKQFAFIHSEATNSYYLYSVGKNMFVKKDGNFTKLTEAPEQTISFLNGTRKADYPWVIAFNTTDGQKQIAISNSYDYGVITFYNDLKDAGNTIRLEKVNAFAPETALTKIEAYETAAKKVELLEKIGEANEFSAKTYLPQDKRDGLSAAATTAQGVYDNPAATCIAVVEQITIIENLLNSCVYVTSPEGFSNNAIYTIVAKYNNGNAYVMYDADASQGENGNYYAISSSKNFGNDVTIETGETIPGCQWALYTSTSGKHYLYNIGAGKFMGTSNTGNGYIPLNEVPTSADLIMKKSAVEEYPIMFSVNNGAGVLNHNNGDSFPYGLLNWHSTAGWNDTASASNVHKVTVVGALEEETLATIEELVNKFETIGVKQQELKTLLDNIYTGYYDTWSSSTNKWRINEGVNNYSQQEGDEDFVAAYDNARTYVDLSLEETSIEAIQAQIDRMNGLVANLTINQPENGKYYRIRCTDGNKYLSSNTNDAGRILMTSATDQSNIFYYTNGGLLSYNRGVYIHAESSSNQVKLREVAKTSTAEFIDGKDNNKSGSYIIYVKNSEAGAGRYIHGKNDTTDSGKDKPINGVYQGYTWWLEEVTELPVNITTAGYASFYAPVAVTVSSGIEAHYLTKIIGEFASMTKIESGKIPANTGVMLTGANGEPATEGTYDFEITNDVSPIEGNMFEGTVATEYVTGDAYVLAIKDNNVGLYSVTLNKENGNAFQNNSHKAYLPASALTPAQMSAGFRFSFGGTTDIEVVETESENVKAIYDLTGRKLESIAGPGIYIIDGKKIIIR